MQLVAFLLDGEQAAQPGQPENPRCQETEGTFLPQQDFSVIFHGCPIGSSGCIDPVGSPQRCLHQRLPASAILDCMINVFRAIERGAGRAHPRHRLANNALANTGSISSWTYCGGIKRQ